MRGLLGGDYGIMANGSENMRDCKPDPEEELQRARKRRLKIQTDIDAFMEFDSYSFQRELAFQLLGSMMVAKEEAIQVEHHWLEQINDEADAT